MELPYGPVNVELFQKVKAFILEEPRRLNMIAWMETWTDKDVEKYNELPPCGTTMCIAGTAYLLSVADKITKQTVENHQRKFTQKAAADFLGLDYNQSENIFHLYLWPEEFAKRYNNTNNAQERAQATADYIDYICGLHPESN